MSFFNSKKIAADSVESPCNNQCELDGNQICKGCARSIDEITIWSSATESTKRKIVAKAKKRLAEKNR